MGQPRTSTSGLGYLVGWTALVAVSAASLAGAPHAATAAVPLARASVKLAMLVWLFLLVADDGFSSRAVGASIASLLAVILALTALDGLG